MALKPIAKPKRSNLRRRRMAPQRPLWLRWRANFLTGLVIVAPVTLTAYLIWTVITFVDGKIVPLVPRIYNPDTYLGFHIPGFGLAMFILFTAVVGALTKNLFGKQLVLMAEGWVERMPVVRSVYNGVKQIIETVLTQSSGASFQKACLIEYPRKGLWSVAFVSTQTKGEVVTVTGGEPMTSVFLPTTPNPTSGFLLFVPATDVVLLDMTVEEAAKLVISAGLVTPPSAQEKAAGIAARNAEGTTSFGMPRRRKTDFPKGKAPAAKGAAEPAGPSAAGTTPAE